MTPRSIRRAAERKANKLAHKAPVNGQNAQFSTGPVTEAGKAKSSLNALTFALTGRTVLLPTDDAARYQAHVQECANHFQPKGPEEQSLVQSLADTSWRLARIPGLETAIFAQGSIEFAEEFEDQAEPVRCALIEAQTYLAYEKQIRNLHLQEARLVRRREKETVELRRLQQERIARELREASTQRAALEDGRPLTLNISDEVGFDFSNAATTPVPHSPSASSSYPLQVNAA